MLVAVICTQPTCSVEVAESVVVRMSALFMVVVAENVHGLVMVVRAVVAPTSNCPCGNNPFPTMVPSTASTKTKRYFILG